MPEFELYDLREDPGEKRNVFSRDEAAARALSALLLECRKGERSANPGADLDSETKEQLRALGYLE